MMQSSNHQYTKKNPRIAVVIPFYNEERFIGKTLRSYTKLFVQFPGSFFVLVNNNSTDRTIQVIRAFRQRYPSIAVHLTEELNPGVKYARKTGLTKAAELGADMLLSTDADTVLLPRLVPTLCREVLKFWNSRNDLFVAEGRTESAVSIKRFVYFRRYVTIRRTLWNICYRLFGPYAFGAFFIIKAACYKRILPYYRPETLSGNEGEDLLLGKIAYFMNARFLLSKKAYIVTSSRRMVGDPLSWIVGKRGSDNRMPGTKHADKQFRNIQKLIRKDQKVIEKTILTAAAELVWFMFELTASFIQDTSGRYPVSTRAMQLFVRHFQISDGYTPGRRIALKNIQRHFQKTAPKILAKDLGLSV